MSWPRLLLFAVLAVAAVAAAGVGYVMHWQQAPLAVTEPHVVNLERGEPFARFAQRLNERGLVDHPVLLRLLGRLTGDARRAHAGEYEIRPGDTPASLLARLARGGVVTYQVTVVEGWTAMQAVSMLSTHPVLERELEGVDVHTLLDVLGLPGGHAEGLFFPDTYQFVRGDSDADILRRAYRRMARVLDEAWAGRDGEVPYESPYQALVAASLIEKETGRDEDRAQISQVFALRLARGMRLQTDPTVIYGIGAAFDGNLRRPHLRDDTPYNTYTRGGLPPTPIALPGRDAIEAALHPAEGEFLYFVSRGDGTSKFSESLDEHQQAVRRYQMP